jgi:hypothetical protein
MLKITHLPYVAAILLYENIIKGFPARQSLSSMDKRPGSSPHVKRYARSLRQSIGRPSTLTIALRGDKSEASLVRTPLRGERLRHSMTAADSTVDELRWAVSKLTGQVEELTRRLDQRASEMSPIEEPFD